MFWIGLVSGAVLGVVLEHRFDLLKPKHERRIEQELRELRTAIREWLKRG